MVAAIVGVKPTCSDFLFIYPLISQSYYQHVMQTSRTHDLTLIHVFHMDSPTHWEVDLTSKDVLPRGIPFATRPVNYTGAKTTEGQKNLLSDAEGRSR